VVIDSLCFESPTASSRKPLAATKADRPPRQNIG